MQNTKDTKAPRTNDRIRALEVRLVDEKGEMIGIVSTSEALARAQSLQLDLVEVAPEANPPVCKILDYGKLRFEERKKKSLMKKKQKTVETKELQFRIKIEEHDYQVKKRHAERFLSSGAKVRIVLRFKGREMGYQELGQRLMDRIVENLADFGTPESAPKMEGRRMLALLNPIPKSQKTTPKEQKDLNETATEEKQQA